MMHITLPDKIAQQVQSRAKAKGVSPDKLVVDIVRQAIEFDDDLGLEDLVAEIQAMPPNLASIRPARGSLLETLENAPGDPDFDQKTWDKAWEEVEAELKAITQADDIAEKRR